MNAVFGDQWRALQRESQLAAQQIASGVTALGRANHAETGLYYQAFFGISTGFERVGKLIYVANHAIENGGAFPTDADLKKLGHNLIKLLDYVDQLARRLDQNTRYIQRPSEAVHQGIEHALYEFAEGSRYYNLDLISSSAKMRTDPISLWWNRVAVPILKARYSAKRRKRDAALSVIATQEDEPHVAVLHTNEDGTPIRSLEAYFGKAPQTALVQKYGRLHVLQIARWLMTVLWEVSHRGAYELRIEPLVGLYEPFKCFYNDDAYFRDHKTWRLYL